MRCHAIALALVVGAASGCATTDTMREAPLSEGKTQTFAAPFDTVLEATRESIPEAGFGIQEVNQVDAGTTAFIAEKSGGAFSYGERVRVLVQRQGDAETLVRVLTKKKMATNVFAKGDWSDTLFQLIGSRLTP